MLKKKYKMNRVSKRRKREEEKRRCYVLQNSSYTWSTPLIMWKSFFDRSLLPWLIIAKRMHLPRDLSRLIAQLVPRDYVLHPVWEFIETNRHVQNSCCVVIYNVDPLYNYKDDPRAVRKRPFNTNRSHPRFVYMHDKTTVWVVAESQLYLWSIGEGTTVIRLNH